MAVLPDVVGMNHRLAQDTLRANGFHLVPAGTQASTVAPVTLYSQKIGE